MSEDFGQGDCSKCGLRLETVKLIRGEMKEVKPYCANEECPNS